MKFWNIEKNEKGEPELRIEGDIEMEQEWYSGSQNRSAPAIQKEIKKLDGKNITVWINSSGGEVFAASVIYTALKEHRGKVTVKIDGTAISAASVIAMAGDQILMSPTSVMMVHNPLTIAIGEAKDMEHAVKVLEEVKETIINAYALKTRKSRQHISKLMDEETWMSASSAIQMGFADGMLYEDKTVMATNTYVNGAKLLYNSIKKNPIDINKLVERINTQSKKTDSKDSLSYPEYTAILNSILERISN